MSRTDLAPRATTETVQYVDVSATGQPKEEHQANPLLVLHALLRGRYWIAITLAVIGLVGGGVAGYKIRTPQYRSTAMIRVKPMIDPVLHQNEKNGVLPMFDAFVESQVALIRSQRVIDQAMQADEWKALGRGLTPDDVAQFSENLEAVRPRGSEMIFVNFSDEDPKAAMVAAKAVVEAYNALYGENSTDADTRKSQLLEDLRVRLTSERKSKYDAIRKLGEDLGAESLDESYEQAIRYLREAEAAFKQSEQALLSAQSRRAGDKGATTQPSQLSAEVLAQTQPSLRKLLDQKDSLQMQLETTQLRLGENHPLVNKAAGELSIMEKRIDEVVELYRLAGTPEPVPGQAPNLALASVEQLQEEKQRLEALVQQRKAEAKETGLKRMRMDDLRGEADETDKKLQAVVARIDQLNVESPLSGRIEIISSNDRPLQPFNDKRTQFAAVGALGLGGLGVGCVLLFGLLDRRVRNIADAHKTSGKSHRVLGVLPSLPDDLSDPDEAALAAHSVHHIRAQLQMGLAGSGCRALAITSPSPGAGKTSLACALGLSFAASGSRTLLIDCDIVGGGLTARMDKVIRRRIGQILRRCGLLDDEQVGRVLQRAGSTGERFGGAAVALGFVEDIDVEHAAGIQQDAIVGLREVLGGEAVMDCVTGSGTPGLFLLPLGSAGRQHVGQLSERSVRRIIDEARHHFDVILVDTGPILGSLEASVVAMAVDNVVLAVARGEDRALAERAIDHLRSHGADIAGMVFNRAHREDIVSSGYSSSVSLMPSHVRRELPFDPASAASVSRLGPIATAVFAATDMSGQDSNP